MTKMNWRHSKRYAKHLVIHHTVMANISPTNIFAIKAVKTLVAPCIFHLVWARHFNTIDIYHIIWLQINDLLINSLNEG